jgi:hypothetical protein
VLLSRPAVFCAALLALCIKLALVGPVVDEFFFVRRGRGAPWGEAARPGGVMVLCTSLGVCEAGGVGRGCVTGACIPLICCCCFESGQ